MVALRSDDPIFVLGILPRSGTNFLFNLLRLHPDCGVPEPIWEDYVLEPSSLLMEYTQAVYGWWDAAVPAWGVNKGFEERLCQHLGLGLISFLSSQADGKRLLTKTPCVTNLNNFFRLFPNAYMLILVRDGRDVVESGARSFGWDRDATTRRWAEAAEAVLRFTQEDREHESQCLVVRYEDLYLDCDAELRKILDFVRLDASSYDFDAARDLPVYGSSRLGATDDWVHWEPVDKKTSDFNPLGRWHGWSRRMHERFNWIAGRYLNEFDYQQKSYAGHEGNWRAYNRIVDIVQKNRVYELFPDPVWRLIRGIGYRLLGLGGAAARHQGDKQ